MGSALDIRSSLYNSISGSTFVLDTNVLYWTFYPKCTYSQGYQKIYADKLVLLKARNKFITLSTSIAELFSIIEKTEYNLYKDANYPTEDFSLKDFRQINSERLRLGNTLELIYDQLKAFTSIKKHDIPAELMQEYAQKYASHRLDPYDYILVDYCKTNGLDYVITDDGDFSCTLEYLNILTANNIYFKDISAKTP